MYLLPTVQIMDMAIMWIKSQMISTTFANYYSNTRPVLIRRKSASIRTYNNNNNLLT